MIQRLNEIYDNNNFFTENMQQMKKQVGYQSPKQIQKKQIERLIEHDRILKEYEMQNKSHILKPLSPKETL